ncbi:hypothetical protein SDC9_08750 [bioreactor metagenome]|jgi:cell division protein FtsQ|uniref:Cell division protein FtsQ n=1 Tax=bioreactor metagenome TaxID=1076179 RepID=A0A644T8H9_9ZZZZ|nr:hypothetical protein [Lentimicrobium sp.]MEA5109350.1 hypothetical protein [Lentimicrobium sp.]
MRKAFVIFFWGILVAAVASLFVFANQKQQEVTCPEFVIAITNDGPHQLISEQYIRQQITHAGYRIKGQRIADIRAGEIQELLRKNPFIRSANITIGVNGSVKANIIQRQPLIRVFTETGRQFYIDSEGVIMPVNADFTARVVIANGHIPDVSSKSESNGNKEVKPEKNLHPALKKVFLTARAVKQDAFSEALTEQIYINATGEIELIPKLGNHTILLGDTTLLNDKLNNLKLFYKQGIRNDAWNKYVMINLKFRDQVVCSKSTQYGTI